MITEVHTYSQSVDANTIPMADIRQSETNGISFSNRVKEIIDHARSRSDNPQQLLDNTTEEEFTKFTIFPFQIKEEKENNGNLSSKEKSGSLTISKDLWNIEKEKKSKERITLENILNLKEMIVQKETEDIAEAKNDKNQITEKNGVPSEKKPIKGSETKDLNIKNASDSLINNTDTKQEKISDNKNTKNQDTSISKESKLTVGKDGKLTDSTKSDIKTETKVSDLMGNNKSSELKNGSIANPETIATNKNNHQTDSAKSADSKELDHSIINNELVRNNSILSNQGLVSQNQDSKKVNAENATSKNTISSNTIKTSTKIGDLGKSTDYVVNNNPNSVKSSSLEKAKELIGIIENSFVGKSESSGSGAKGIKELSLSNLKDIKERVTNNDVQLINKIKENMRNDNEIKANVSVNAKEKPESTNDQQNIKTKISDLIRMLGNSDGSSDLEHISIIAKKNQLQEKIESKNSYDQKVISDPFNHREAILGFSKSKNDQANDKNKKDTDLKGLHNLINGKMPQPQSPELSTLKSNLGDSSFSQSSKSIGLQEFGSTTMSMIKSMPSNTIHSARLMLQPQSLGTVMIEISLTNNIAKLDIRVDSREAAKSIESQLSVLKDKLANEGIKMDSVDVKLSNFEKDAKNNNGQDSGFARRENTDVKKEYLNTFGFLKDTPEIDEQENYKSVRTFIEQGNSLGNYLQQ